MKKVLNVCMALLLFSSAFAQRDTIPLTVNWAFQTDPNAEGEKKEWMTNQLPSPQEVTIPHTWNVDSLNQSYYGTSWYQKILQAPVQWKGKKVQLTFGAINHTATIYLNGKKIEENVGDGYSKFSIDISDALQYGKSNLLSISVNNAYSGNKVPFSNSFDWPNDGGLIREVYLIVSGKPGADYIHLKPVYTFPDQQALLHITMGYKDVVADNIMWRVRIMEDNQPTLRTILDKTVRPTRINAGFTSVFQLDSIHPWHFDRPNLYRAEITVLKNGKAIDWISSSTGFRDIQLTDGKFFLNGEAIRLMGVEWTAGSNPAFGLAEPKSEILRYSSLMKDVNCIFSRQHFQQDDAFYDFCDRNGILLHQELPLWGPETPASEAISRIAHKQLERMILSFYNHPSIFAWGVGNELAGRDPSTRKMIAELIDKARKSDPSRFAGYVSNTLTNGFRNQPDFVPDAAAHGDYIMMNEYGGSWWEVPQGLIHTYLDSIHNSYPDKPFFISEFGLCEPNFKGGDERRLEDLVYHMAVYETKPYVNGAIYFDLTDYRTHYPGTQEQNKFRRRIHGVFDMYGNPRPSMKTLRELSSPVEVQQVRNDGKGNLQVLLFGNIGLPQHRVLGYKLFVSNRTDNFREGTGLELPIIDPGKKYWITVPNTKGKVVTIVRPTGFVTSQKEF